MARPMGENFRQYAKFYDLINSGRPYLQEASYVRAKLQGFSPSLSEVLEFGSGTGGHG
jgi:hypothetical protein